MVFVKKEFYIVSQKTYPLTHILLFHNHSEITIRKPNQGSAFNNIRTSNTQGKRPRWLLIPPSASSTITS